MILFLVLFVCLFALFSFVFSLYGRKVLSDRSDFVKAGKGKLKAPFLPTYYGKYHIKKNNPLLQKGEGTNEYWPITLLQLDPHHTQINIHKPPSTIGS